MKCEFLICNSLTTVINLNRKRKTISITANDLVSNTETEAYRVKDGEAVMTANGIDMIIEYNYSRCTAMFLHTWYHRPLICAWVVRLHRVERRCAIKTTTYVNLPSKSHSTECTAPAKYMSQGSLLDKQSLRVRCTDLTKRLTIDPLQEVLTVG